MRTNDSMQNEPGRTRVGAVVLAAGLSVRMGAPKALLPWGSKPIIGHVVETLSAAGGITPVVVVTGHQAGQVEAAVAAFGVRCVHNPHFAGGGMLSSVLCGMSAIASEVDAVALLLGDQPAVCATTLQRLIGAWRESGAPLVIPTYQGQRGHPVIFSSVLLPEILAIRPPKTLRDLVHRNLHLSLQLAVDDPGVVGDVDTPEDYRRAVAQWEKAQK